MPRIHTDQLPSVAVSPDGKRIATGSGGKTIILWDATSGQLLRQLRGHRNLVLGLTFDPSGQRLLSAGRDNDLRLWDVASGTTLRVFQGHVAGLWSVIVRDGYAYTAANDGTLRRWPLEQSGQWFWDLEDQEPISARLLPDPVGNATGNLLIGFASGAVRGYALPPETSGHSSSPRLDPESAATADPGDTLVVSSPNAPRDLRLTFARYTRTGCKSVCSVVEWTDTCYRRRGQNGDSLSLESLHRFEQHSDVVYAVTFSPDGRLLATAGYDGQIGLRTPAPGISISAAHRTKRPAGLRSPSPWAALPSTASPTPIPPPLSARKPATGGMVLTTNHTNPRKTSSRTEGDVVKAPPGAIDENLCSL